MQSLRSELKRTNKTDKKQSLSGCFLFFKDNYLAVIGSVIAIAICMYGLGGVYGFSAFPDEFGYWSPAASFLGYDWSKVTSLGSYYSYGYSILLVPFLLLFHDSIVAYRAAIVLNLSLQCLGASVLCSIMRCLFPDSPKQVRGLSAVIAILYPAWIFYTQTTMAESLIYFLLVFSVFVLMHFFQKPSVLRVGLLIIILFYQYMVHMRCIGIVAAGVITILVWLFRNRSKKIMTGISLMAAVLIFLFAGTLILKNIVIDELYYGVSNEMISWNDYSGIGYRIRKIISVGGLGFLLKDICGKVLYIGCSTYGIAYLGLYGCIKRTGAGFKTKRNNTSFYIWLYVLLIVIFQFLVALVYLNGASAPNTDRLDNFLHGRYIDIFLPLLICIGIEELLCINIQNLKRLYIIIAAVFAASSVVAYYVIKTNDFAFQNAHGFTMIGMSYFLREPLMDVISYYFKEIALTVILAMAVICAVMLYRSYNNRVFLMPVLIIQIVLGILTLNNFVFMNQSYIYGDIVAGKELKRLRELYPDKEVLHIYDGGPQYIELVQFTDREADIQTINNIDKNIPVEECFDGSDILLIGSDSDYVDFADDIYGRRTGFGHFFLYFNP